MAGLRNHQWFLSEEVAQVFCDCSKRKQKQLLRIFRSIGQAPHASAEEEITIPGRKRPAFAGFFDDWQVVWWIDEPVWEVHILEIQPLMT